MAYKKTPETEEILKKLQEKEDTSDFERIRCPLCDWRPTAASRWTCADADAPEYFYNACYTSWNTFETRGRCPGCGHQWIWTSCLFCHGWSRHEDWYEIKRSANE
jgi:hypothetical protein